MSTRDTLADVIERQGALLSTGSDQQDWFRAVEIADALMPTVEAMLAQARGDVVVLVQAALDAGVTNQDGTFVDVVWVERALAACGELTGSELATTRRHRQAGAA